MAKKFFPGCKVKARYPEASAWLAEQVVTRGYADEVVGCCRVEHQGLTSEDTAVCERGIFTPLDSDAIQQKLEEHAATILVDEVCCYCTACDAGLEAGGKDAINILELISGKFRTE